MLLTPFEKIDLFDKKEGEMLFVDDKRSKNGVFLTKFCKEFEISELKYNRQKEIPIITKIQSFQRNTGLI